MAGGLIAVVVILIIVGILATQVLSRLGFGSRATDRAQAQFAAAAAALEQFASSAQRLPCPADPTLDTGEELILATNTAACDKPEGTLPWKTIGMRREDSIDPWGRRISYRVYTGTAGSLTQPGGASMVECDTDDAADATTPNGIGGGGLCAPNADPTLRATMPAKFLAGKGLLVTDSGTAHADAAFVLVSHGESGLGGYTSAGVRMDLPAAGGDERNNTAAAGPFTIRAFSDAGTDATLAAHFDDLLFYRTVPDLVKRANLSAHNWPDATGTTSAKLDSPTLTTALGGTPPTTGDIGTGSLTIGGATVTGRDSGGATTNLSYDDTGTTPGIGVYEGGNMLSSDTGEYIRVDLSQKAKRFAMTLYSFGTYDYVLANYTEKAELKFFNGTVQVAVVPLSGCRAETLNPLASFSEVTAGSDAFLFDRVEITPKAATEPGGATSVTAFLLSEFKACAETDTTCETSLADASNKCP